MIPRKIDIVSSTVGSATITGWKRRAKAASFSTYLRYSSRVVAPIQCNSPRAKAGLIKFAASMAPSVFPAPTNVCISSTKSITSPNEADISLRMPFKRSSNSPLNFVPAIKAPISRAKSFLFFKLSGTSPFIILRAIPSAIAVLPTPGSPIKTGLFLVRRLKTCIERRISSSRPMIGSILPSLAA